MCVQMDPKTTEDMIDQGWYISDEGYNVISDNGNIKDVRKLIQIALDTDLKEIGKTSLPNDFNKSKISNVVLQIQKIRNASAPKSNEDSQAAPRMLKLVLTDGINYCQALEMSPLLFLNHNKTVPGSKLLIKAANFISGYLMLEQNSCQFLGGQVPALYEKWQINKSVSHHARARFDGEGPPPWVNFGKKIISADELASFKSLEQKSKNKESTEFDMQRKDAIAEVANGAVRKAFGGGLKQNLANQNTRPTTSTEPREPRKFQPRERKPRKDAIDEEKPLKPSDKISLFDFLETKLPVQEEIVYHEVNNSYRNYDNNPKLYNKPSYNSHERNNQTRFNNDTRGNNSRMYQNQPKPRNYRQNYNDNSYQQKYNDNSYPQTIPEQQPEVKQTVHEPKQSLESNIDRVEVNSLSNSFNKMNVSNVNSEFASRSLKQHLNIQRESRESQHKPQMASQYTGRGDQPQWKKGDQCKAKYWEDNKFYSATVTAVTNKTCVVQFNEYGNFEEVLHCDCLPSVKDGRPGNTMEFRRGGNRPYKNNKNFVKSNF